MNLNNLKISTQLKLGFAAMILLVIVLGAVSYMQTSSIHSQIETMYNHPLQVRRAIGSLSTDILTINSAMKDLFLAANENEFSHELGQIEIKKADALDQIEKIRLAYLGPGADVDSLKSAFIVWIVMCDETTRFLRENKSFVSNYHAKNHDVFESQVQVFFAALDKIDNFARAKGDSLYENSKRLKDYLHLQLAILIAIILLLSFIINYLVIKNIRVPLSELARAAREFTNGNFDARSAYLVSNEFGTLTTAFNELARSIQLNFELSEKTTQIARLMLSEDDAKKFFFTTLSSFAHHTSSNMAAVYLRSQDKKHFEHFQSIGTDIDARQTFAAESYEGEFGLVLSTLKVQHIKNIPQDSRFKFNTVNGTFVAREIITIPIISNNEVTAIISLASLCEYSKESLHLVNKLLDTLSARIDGIMSYRKLKELSELLKNQNHELQAQQTEMAAQSAELMAQNRELESQKQQLDQAGRLKTTFLSNMSHELRTPLNSGIALSGVLNRRLGGKLPAEEYSYIEVIERNGKQLLELINDILDIARIESGREEMEITRFSVNALVAEVVDLIDPLAEQKNIELQFKSSGPEIFIESDSDKYRHVLQNIIGNAVKFTEKGSVKVEIRQIDETIAISVTDTGIGIAKDQLPYIFDEFRQADSSTSRRFGGTGLGLAIAKKYSTMLGGVIGVISETGKGSTFTITIPMRFVSGTKVSNKEIAAPYSLHSGKSRGSNNSSKENATILLVEDSEPAIIQMRDILECSGYRIVTARGGNEALALIETMVPDAIILDLMMPGIDGFAVLESLRNAQPTAHVPVLILTAKHITKEELSFLKRNNIHQLIQKGDVNRVDLLDAISAMVHQHDLKPLKPVSIPQTIAGKPVLLMVEDNPDNMLTMRALLADNYILLEATSGTAGVEMAKIHKPHCILMDVGLPEKDGIEAFEAIRKNCETSHIPVIAVTASAMTTDRETILAHGFDAYIPKPIDADQLFTCIREILYG